MFIKLAYNYLHDSWRYLVGLGVIFFIWQLGTMPFALASMFTYIQDGGDVNVFLADQNIMMSVLDSNLTFFLVLLSFAIGLAAIWFWARFIHKQPMKALTTSRKKTDWSRIWFAFALIVSFTVVTTLIDYYNTPEDYVVQFDLVPFLILLAIALVFIPIQTSFEEYFFRGYLMQGLGVMARNRWVPLFVTSIIFGGLHMMNPEVEKIGYIIMVFYIGTGFFLGLITLMDEGMELALGFHAGNNLIASLLVTADWTAFKTNSILLDVAEPTVGFQAVLPVFIIYPIFIGIMAWRYKWTGWKEKLFGKISKPEPESEFIKELET